eukprot:9473414-Pyramimonas_sp.AAC.1
MFSIACKAVTSWGSVVTCGRLGAGLGLLWGLLDVESQALLEPRCATLGALTARRPWGEEGGRPRARWKGCPSSADASMLCERRA